MLIMFVNIYFALLKVAPYSFTIACTLRMKAQVICARSKQNLSVFWYFLTSTWAQKAKLTVNFLTVPLVKFPKIWQIGSIFYFSQGSFFREIYKTRFFAAVKDINLKKSKKLPLQTRLFLCLKFISCWKWCVVKILEDFTLENSRKSQIKPHKQ